MVDVAFCSYHRDRQSGISHLMLRAFLLPFYILLDLVILSHFAAKNDRVHTFQIRRPAPLLLPSAQRQVQ